MTKQKSHVGKWKRDPYQSGAMRTIHGHGLIGQYIVRSSSGWRVVDCPAEYGVSGKMSEHRLLRDAKAAADNRVYQN